MTADFERVLEAAGRAYVASPVGADPLEAIVSAVLIELREASEPMMDAGSLCRYRYRHSRKGPNLTSEQVDALAFTAMIDHILAEPATA